MQRPKLEANRSQFGCELGLCGAATDCARKRNFEARDVGCLSALFGANLGPEMAMRWGSRLATS